MILYYDRYNKFKDRKIFYWFLMVSVINANLTSNLFSPNFLKIGSSLASSILLT